MRSVHWLPLDALLSARWRGTLEVEHQGSLMTFPCLRYEGLTIWGLTYRMFCNLESVLL